MTTEQLKAIEKEAEAYAAKEYNRNPLPGHPDFDLHTVYSESYKAGYMANPGKLLSSAYDALKGMVEYWEWAIKDPHFREYKVAKEVLSQLPEPPITK